MITKKLLRNLNEPRKFAMDHITTLKKTNTDLKVVDVGGGVRSWCPDTTHIVDCFGVPGSIEALRSRNPGISIFNLDINQRDQWTPVLKHVEEHGKFDFSICTHTLEDIAYPDIACEMLIKISKAGLIAIPSRFIENARFEKKYAVAGYKGFYHHRWIFAMRYNELIGYEKSSYWEHVSLPGLARADIIKVSELCFMWEGDFQFSFVNHAHCIGADNLPPRFSEVALRDDLD